MNDIFTALFECLREEQPVAVATIIEVAPLPSGSGLTPQLGASMLCSPDVGLHSSISNGALESAVRRDLEDPLASGMNATRNYGTAGEPGLDDVTVFFDVYSPPARIIIVGAVDFTRALVKVAKVLGYRVTVCDARPEFATTKRFPEADEVVAQLPARYLETVGDRLGPLDAICVLTHDHTYDVPAIAAALQTRVGYLGAMGSRGTHAERVALLLGAGVRESRIHEIMAPIGLKIGARNPEETAISICAEIIAIREGVKVESLRDGSGPIHTVVTTA